MSVAVPTFAAGMAGFAMRSAMAAIFVIAAVHALRDRDAYAQTVQAYRILPETPGAIFAALLPPLECMVAVALVLPSTRFFGSAAALALLACFTGAITANLARGRHDIACGCGGGAGQKISWELVVRNALLFGGLALSMAAPVHPHFDAACMIGIAGLASFLVVLYLAANQLMDNARVAQS